LGTVGSLIKDKIVLETLREAKKMIIFNRLLDLSSGLDI